MSSPPTIISFRPEHVIRHLPWRLDSKAALGFLLILATFSLVGWLYLTQASAVTATTYRIDELRLELDRLQNQNAALTLEIAQLEALGRIEQRASELGLRATTDVRYLAVSNYPLSPDTAAIAYSNSAIRTEAEISLYDTELEPSSWWVTKLDSFVAWLEGEQTR